MSSPAKLVSLVMFATLQIVTDAVADRTVAFFRVAPAAESGDGDRETAAEYDRYFQTQLVLLSSPMVLNAALADLQDRSSQSTQSLTLEQLTNSLEVERLIDSEVLRVTLAQGHGESVAVLNAVVDAYQDRLGEIDNLGGTLDTNAIQGLDEKIKVGAEIIRRLAEQFSSSNSEMIGIRIQLEADKLRELNQNRMSLRRELSKLVNAGKSALGSGLAANGQNALAVEKLLDRDPLYAAAKQQLARIQQASALTSETSPPTTSASGAEFRAELQAAQRALVRRREELTPLLERQLKEEVGSEDDDEVFSTRIAAAHLRLKLTQLTEVEREFTQQLDILSKLTSMSSDLATRKADLEVLIEAKKAAKSRGQRPTSRVTCIQRAMQLDW